MIRLTITLNVKTWQVTWVRSTKVTCQVFTWSVIVNRFTVRTYILFLYRTKCCYLLHMEIRLRFTSCEHFRLVESRSSVMVDFLHKVELGARFNLMWRNALHNPSNAHEVGHVLLGRATSMISTCNHLALWVKISQPQLDHKPPELNLDMNKKNRVNDVIRPDMHEYCRELTGIYRFI